MRPSSLCRLVFAVLLSAGAAHAQPFASPQQPPQPAQEPAKKSAALTTKTAFKLDPYKVIRSKFLQAQARGPIATPAELELLNDANDGHVDHFSMARATLVICGVEDPAQQQHYLAYLK